MRNRKAEKNDGQKNWREKVGEENVWNWRQEKAGAGKKRQLCRQKSVEEKCGGREKQRSAEQVEATVKKGKGNGREARAEEGMVL